MTSADTLLGAVRRRPLRALGSLRLAFAGMLALLVAVLASHRADDFAQGWVAAALALLAINLGAALLERPQFRRQHGLLVFHLCLLVVIVLAAAGSMTRLHGRVELVEGQRFDADAVVIVTEAPWHPRRLDRVGFVQGGIGVDYAPGLIRRRTHSELLPTDEARSPAPIRIGDTRSVSLSGYRFLTTSNKGYAVLLTWRADGADAISGAVHMPSYPLYEWNQRNLWRTARGQALELELVLPVAPRERAWRLDSERVDARLRLREADDGDPADTPAATLSPGQSVALDGGVLRFDGLRMWMGYRIEFDPFLPWLFVAAVVGVAGLGWHFWRKLGSASSDAPVAATAR